MINNLNVHSQMIPQADAGVSSEVSLMNLIGKGSSLDENLNQEDILALLSSEGDAKFSDVLSTEISEKQNFEGLIQNLDKMDLNSDEIKKLIGLLEKLNTNTEKIDLSQVMKSSEGSPKLQAKIEQLIELNSKNGLDNKSIKDVSNLIIKDQTTSVKATNLKDVINNKAEINKMLGLSSEDIIDVKKESQAKDNSFMASTKKNLAKNFLVEDNKIIKNQSSALNSILSKDKNVNDFSEEQSQNLDFSTESENSEMVKLDNSTIIKTNKVNETTKSMDINQVMNKSNSQAEVITKIQDYIIQSKVSNESNVNLTFNHSDLGDVNLNVQKMTGDNLAVTITSNNSEAVKFFTENKSELLQTLTNSGLNISEMKLENTNSSNKDSNSNNQNFSDSKQNFSGSKQSEQERESKKRQELWELFDKEIA